MKYFNCRIGVGIIIGFCTIQFPKRAKRLGYLKNSIGICEKGYMWIDGRLTNLENGGGYFKAKDMLGIGIVHIPTHHLMRCFATLNGQLLGKKLA